MSMRRVLSMDKALIIFVIILALVSVVALAIGIGWATMSLALKIFNEMMEAFNGRDKHSNGSV